MIKEDENVTFTTWSWRVLRSSKYNDDCYRAMIHMQGVHVGREDNIITACGIRRVKLNPHGAFDGWDYGDTDVHPRDWQGCRRCEAAYRQWAARQKKVSAE